MVVILVIYSIIDVCIVQPPGGHSTHIKKSSTVFTELKGKNCCATIAEMFLHSITFSLDDCVRRF